MARALADDVAAVAAIEVIPKILEVVCRTTGMGFAAVARVTEDRWIACAVRDQIDFGLKPGGELKIETTICNEIRDSGTAVVIDHVAEDPAFQTHHTPALYGFQSYISTPIRYRGQFFGTLCAIDPRPANLRASEMLATFELFADLIGAQLDAQDRISRSEAALIDEREAAELREQFIAVLGHDLRNPLAAIGGGARLLRKSPTAERAAWIMEQMEASVGRMTELIDNVMDFARGRLGGGFAVHKALDPNLPQVLEQVIVEARTANSGREILADIALDQPVACDSRRIAQVFSNLLANAVTHGDAVAPVSISAMVRDGAFELTVANRGEPIPQIVLQRLFRPFYRASAGPTQQGLGLGLYIASEIVRAHGGTLAAASDAEETRFTCRIPLV